MRNSFLHIFIFISCNLLYENILAQGQKISQFETAGLCDFMIDKSGIYHVVFQESPDKGKPTFIYYSSSANKGKTWSKPITLSNDNTGNGAGYTRILQDGNGLIYAIWKRYGNTASNYPVPDVILDGPGGYTLGTLFYKVLSGGAWSNAIQLNEAEAAQNSWFATLDAKGYLRIVWDQLSPASIKSKQYAWYYCDYVRTTVLTGTNHSPFADLSKPSPPGWEGGVPPQKGGQNLDGYIDAAGLLHMIYEDLNDNSVRQIKYFDGKTITVVYRYPLNKEGNTFHNPARLLKDETGTDHLLFRPSAATLESEQIWDINLATNKTNVLLEIQKKGVSIKGFQAYQGPKGAMAIVIEAGGYSDNTEAFGIFYNNGTWTNVGLTKNAAKEKFFSKDFIGLGGYLTNIATLTKYNSTFAVVAYDERGKKNMVMNISAYWSTGAYSTSSPSILFSLIDK